MTGGGDPDPASREEVSCALCGSRETRVRFGCDPWTVVDCVKCTLTYVIPRLEVEARIEEVYGADYWRSSAARDRGYADYRGDADLYRRTFRRRWRMLAPFFPRPGRALDVGCAAGYFLDVLAEEGWCVSGIEPSAEIAETARVSHGADALHAEPLESCELPAASFDLVSFWDVLEHLGDPVGALQKARRLLRPEGRVVVETQNIRSLFARLTGKAWHHFKHSEHLVHFHPGTLRRAFAAAGLRILEMTPARAGKYVRGSFLVERSGRISRRLPRLLRPLFGGDWSVYVNLGDELIVVAEVEK